MTRSSESNVTSDTNTRPRPSTQNTQAHPAFFPQQPNQQVQIGHASVQGLQGQDYLMPGQFMSEAAMRSDMSHSPEVAMTSQNQLTTSMLNNAPLDPAAMDGFPEPEWLNNFDFSAATYSSVFQMALPLWPTTNWSPNSFIPQPESPKRHINAENLDKTLPTPGSRHRKDEPGDRPETGLSLLDRVFSRASHPEQRGGHTMPAKRSSYVTAESRNRLLHKLEHFRHVLRPDFVLPSHHALNRYALMYFDAGAKHQPFIHEPTFSAETSTLGLVMAACAMGAKYCFEDKMSSQLWSAGKAIIRSSVDDLDRHFGIDRDCSPEMLENCQGMLLLMMYATWAGVKPYLRHALAFQSGLAAVSDLHFEGSSLVCL
jgi:hypothetical protein